MKKVSRRTGLVKAALQFIKLQLAGNILFIGTLVGVASADKVLRTDPFIGLVVGSALAHVLFFHVNKTWIFGDTANSRDNGEVVRFVLFMTFNFFLNLFLVEITTTLVGKHAPELSAFSYYIGVVGAAVFFAVWSFLGLKFWVFRQSKRHAAVSRYHGLTLEKKRKQENAS